MLSLTRAKTWYKQSTRPKTTIQNTHTEREKRCIEVGSDQRQQNDGIHFCIVFQTTNPNGASMMQYSFHLSITPSPLFFGACVEQIIVPFTTNVPKCSRKPIHQDFDDDQQTASLKRLWTLRIAHTHTHECLRIELTFGQNTSSHRQQPSRYSSRIIRGWAFNSVMAWIARFKHAYALRLTTQKNREKLLWQIHWTAIVWTMARSVWF